MINEFLKIRVFQEPGITKCYIDPEPNNVRAIKVYEKVGFIHVKTVQIRDEPNLAYLMVINKKALL